MPRNGRSTLKTSTDPQDRPWLKRRLTVQQEKFAHFFTGECYGNGEKAAGLAGFKHPRKAAARLLKDPRVVAVVEDHLGKINMTADEVLSRLARIARVSLRDVIDFDPNVDYNGGWFRVNLAKAAQAGIMDLIREIKQTQHGLMVRFESRMDALKVLAQHNHLVDTHHLHMYQIDWKKVPQDILDALVEGRMKLEEIPPAYARTELDGPQAGVVWDVPDGVMAKPEKVQ